MDEKEYKALQDKKAEEIAMTGGVYPYQLGI